MNPSHHLKIKVIQRRSWVPEETVALCSGINQAKQFVKYWQKSYQDKIWSNASLVLDPPCLHFEVEVVKETGSISKSFESISDLEDWTNSESFES